MALNKFMHPRNIYKSKGANFRELALKYPEFRKHVFQDLTGKVYLDFKNPPSLCQLSITLMQEDFGLTVELPLDRLIPTIPLRLNYIHWIEDILKRKSGSEVNGIDIGTGASCVYPLLGHRVGGWSFLATEADEQNLVFAQKNVSKNKLESMIKLVKVTDGMILKDVIAKDEAVYNFCMCNPPFFADHLEAMAITTSRSDDRPEPKSVCTASPGESVVTGGEVGFIKKMIHESLELKSKVRVYTSMVGKKTSLQPIREELKKLQIPKFSTTEFCQGKTMRWGIAWTFDKAVNFPVSLFQESKKKKLPLTYNIPADALDIYNMEAIKQRIMDLLRELKICYKELEASSENVSFSLTATENTWSHQRRRRREMKRKEFRGKTNSPTEKNPKIGDSYLCLKEMSTSGNDVIYPSSDQSEKVADSNIGNDKTNASKHCENVNCKDSLSASNQGDQSTNCNVSSPNVDETVAGGCKNVTISQNRKRKLSVEDENSSETKRAKEERATIPSSSSCSNDLCDVGHNRILVKEPDIVVETGNLHGDIYKSDEFLFKSKLNIKKAKMFLIEMVWEDGGNRELMYQVMQYFKNHLKSDNNNLSKAGGKNVPVL